MVMTTQRRQHLLQADGMEHAVESERLEDSLQSIAMIHHYRTDSVRMALKFVGSILLTLVIQALQTTASLSSRKIAQIIIVGRHIYKPLPLDVTDGPDVVPGSHDKFLIQSPAYTLYT